MGTQHRYIVPMFDTTYRVVRDGVKDETVFGSDVLAEAEAEYHRLVASNSGDVLYLMRRARVVKRSDG